MWRVNLSPRRYGCSSFFFLGLLDVSINEQTTTPLRETTPHWATTTVRKIRSHRPYNPPSTGFHHRCPFRDRDCRPTTCFCPLSPALTVSPQPHPTSITSFGTVFQSSLFSLDLPFTFRPRFTGACTKTPLVLLHCAIH